MNELALFAGAGGGLLGSILLGWRCVCAVEINPYCREVLLRRQEEGFLSPFPVWDDIRSFDGSPWRGKVDVITAGFPCQPWSVAGKQRGEADERNLWPDTIRVIREVGPRFAFLENVPGLLSAPYWGTILGDLAESGFNGCWRVLSAAEVGAPHRRDRVWIVADSGGAGRQQKPRSTHGHESTDEGWFPEEMYQSSSDGERGRIKNVPNAMRCRSGRSMAESQGISGRLERDTCGHGETRNMAVAASNRLQGDEHKVAGEGTPAKRRRSADTRWWAVEPDVGRVAHGVAFRVDRLRALGEGQVPAVVRAAWELLSEE